MANIFLGELFVSEETFCNRKFIFIRLGSESVAAPAAPVKSARPFSGRTAEGEFMAEP